MAKRRKPARIRSAGNPSSRKSVVVDCRNEIGSRLTSGDLAHEEHPHEIEQKVRRELLSHPELRFSSLVIRRTPKGLCLEGVLETDEETSDVCRLIQTVFGVDEVLNHLVVRRPPAKG